MNPLFLLTPNLFVNLDDPSALAQLVAQCDIKQDLLFIAALNIPIGPDGTEYGGIEVADRRALFFERPRPVRPARLVFLSRSDGTFPDRS